MRGNNKQTERTKNMMSSDASAKILLWNAWDFSLSLSLSELITKCINSKLQNIVCCCCGYVIIFMQYIIDRRKKRQFSPNIYYLIVKLVEKFNSIKSEMTKHLM